MRSCLFLALAILTIFSSTNALPSFRQFLAASPKADDSCVSRCGQTGVDTTKPCQCNPSCLTYGDCCTDFLPTCNTCQDRCNAAYDKQWPCQCNTLCVSNSNCCPDYNSLCTGGTDAPTTVKPGSVTNAELVALSSQLHKDDVNSVPGIVLNMQGTTTSGNTADKAPLPLFTSVPADAFEGPTIKALLALFDNYVKEASVSEVVTPEEEAENDAFLDAIMATSVMQQAHAFLASKNLADPSPAVFKEYLRLIWLGLYNRGGGTRSACGLEHVFLGEIANGGVSGFHNWIKYYLEEQADTMNYLGYITRIDLSVSAMIEMPMKWNNIYKSISSIAVSSSPELELALATVCFLSRPNAKCYLQGANGNAYAYQTYTLDYNGNTYVGSAYPTY